jgi:hypothetical protein
VVEAVLEDALELEEVVVVAEVVDHLAEGVVVAERLVVDAVVVEHSVVEEVVGEPSAAGEEGAEEDSKSSARKAD